MTVDLAAGSSVNLLPQTLPVPSSSPQIRRTSSSLVYVPSRSHSIICILMYNLQAFKLNFLTGYTAFTFLPSVVTALVAFPLTYYTFTYSTPRSRDISHPAQAYIPASLLPPDVNPRSAILDPAGAIFRASRISVAGPFADIASTQTRRSWR
jgi:hypothetical protein